MEKIGDAVISTRNFGLVKRALFGLVLWVTLVAGGACLLHASIETDGDVAAGHTAMKLAAAAALPAALK
jgi:hypothetical protein